MHTKTRTEDPGHGPLAGKACPEPAEGSARATPALRPALRLQFRQQLLDAIFLFERGQPVVEVVAGDL